MQGVATLDVFSLVGRLPVVFVMHVQHGHIH